MHDLVQSFPDQLQDAFERYNSLTLPQNTYDAIVCLGMGGSGIAGSFVQMISGYSGSLPYTVCKDYNIPHRITKNTLVIAASHS